LSFFKKILLFISTFALAYFFLECFCSFLATLIFLICHACMHGLIHDD
jgi:hypothetical protein